MTKSRKQEIARVIKQMDSWMQHRTRLTLFISTPLFHLFLRGRMVGRLERLFLFDNYGETCRVLVIPEQYDRVLCVQKGRASITFETSGMQGQLKVQEDDEAVMFEETCVDWVLSKMVADAAS